MKTPTRTCYHKIVMFLYIKRFSVHLQDKVNLQLKPFCDKRVQHWMHEIIEILFRFTCRMPMHLEWMTNDLYFDKKTYNIIGKTRAVTFIKGTVALQTFTEITQPNNFRILICFLGSLILRPQDSNTYI